MQFNEYLKSCRKRYDLTQENLVQELYNFSDIFKGLDTRTLIRWEQGSTKPTAIKQVKIIQLFQKFSTHIFPYFYDYEYAEEELCIVGINNLIGNSKEHIVNFPKNIFNIDDIKISHIRSHENIELILNMPQSIFQGLTSNYFKLTLQLLKNWSLNPSHLFLIAQVKNQFVGMFFTLRIKPNIFKKLISFEILTNELRDEDFARFEEEACMFPISIFAYNDKVASLLYLRFYAHLIANQNTIIEVGTTPLLNGGKKLAEKMHLTHIINKTINGETLSAYSASLEDVLINEDVLKMIFLKHDCPEDKRLFKNLCQSGKITNTQGNIDEDRNRCRAIRS